MEKFEALADLVRTLSKRCEEFERYKENSDTYYRWYKEQRDKCEKLQDQIDDMTRQHESFAARFKVE
jgi:Mg2+ and Co2+ transporter CorA